MRIGAIILKLKLADTTFGNLIGGAAELQEVLANINNGTLTGNQAFVIPAEEEGEEGQNNETSSAVNQLLTENFTILVVIPNDKSRRDVFGYIAYEQLHDIRSELLSALLTWQPQGAIGFINYKRAKLVDMNPAYLWYAYQFGYTIRITEYGVEEEQVPVDPHTAKIFDIAKAIADIKAGKKTSDEYTGKSLDDLKALVPKESEAVDFNSLYTNIILSPDARLPYTGDLPLDDGFPNVEIPDIAQFIDMSKHPSEGGFGGGFATGYNLNQIFEGKKL